MKQWTNERVVYKLSKNGQIQKYSLSIMYDSTGAGPATLLTSYGLLDGVEQQDLKQITEGKNLGRSNETTPYEQAILELNSKLNKLLDKGYKEVPAGENLLQFLNQSEGTDASGSLKPMLAQKDPKKITFPGYAQRKYDGVRCFTFVQGGKIRKVSRNGKPFEHLNHLDSEILEMVKLDPGDLGYMDWVVDGELYSHKLTFQNIISSVKREQPNNKLIEYRIYDMVPLADLTLAQGKRMKIIKELRSLCDLPGTFKYLEFARTHKVNDMGKFTRLFAKFISEGYEGAMFRDMNSPYEFGRRSYSLIKYKEFDEEEFEIMGAEEATGRDAGTAVFLLKSKNGKWFSARPLGTREERADYLINIKQYIGKKGTVKFQGYTDSGVPRFPVFKAVRNYE